MTIPIKNCEGCKWLETIKKGSGAEGYCPQVMLSSQKNLRRKTKYGEVSAKVRDKATERCELYAEGQLATRFKPAKEE